MGNKKRLECTIKDDIFLNDNPNIKIYLQDAARFPLLTRERERELFEKKRELQYGMLERICNYDVGILGRAFGGYASQESMDTDFPLPEGYSNEPFGIVDYTLFIEHSERSSRALRSEPYEEALKYRRLLVSASPQERIKLIQDLVGSNYETIFDIYLIGASKEYLNRLSSRYEESKDLAIAREKGDYILMMDARNKVKLEILSSNLRLVASIAKHYFCTGIPFLDLINEGNIGLMKAVDRFKVDYGHRFSTYATWWIRQAITRSIAENSSNIRIPVHVYEVKIKIFQIGGRFLAYHGREPTCEEYDEMLNLRSGTAERVLLHSKRTISLSTPIGEDGTAELGDRIIDEKGLPPLDIVLAEEARSLVRKALRRMDRKPDGSKNKSRLRVILEMRSGINLPKDLTLEETGNTMRITRERVRQLETKAKGRLRLVYSTKFGLGNPFS